MIENRPTPFELINENEDFDSGKSDFSEIYFWDKSRNIMKPVTENKELKQIQNNCTCQRCNKNFQ